MLTITSSKNHVIKEVKLLKSKKYRDEKKLFFVEGIKLVEEALKGGAEIVRVFLSEGITRLDNELVLRIQAIKCEIYVVPDKLFTELSDTETPQGVLAVIKIPDKSLDIIREENNMLVILDEIQDPGNLGTIIRTADAAGFTGVVLSRGCVDVYNPKVIRSTMGSILHIPFYFSDDLTQTIELIKKKGIKVYAAHLRGERKYYEIDLNKNFAFIIGNEAKGISDRISSQADELVKIPILGKAESLNASVAASILIYEGVRQRLSI